VQHSPVPRVLCSQVPSIRCMVRCVKGWDPQHVGAPTVWVPQCSLPALMKGVVGHCYRSLACQVQQSLIVCPRRGSRCSRGSGSVSIESSSSSDNFLGERGEGSHYSTIDGWVLVDCRMASAWLGLWLAAASGWLLVGSWSASVWLPVSCRSASGRLLVGLLLDGFWLAAGRPQVGFWSASGRLPVGCWSASG
jgi:hypothetical protein